MTAKDGKHQEMCPFWSTTSKKCSICNGGLFIPLDDHEEVFCKTPAFTSCIQHSICSESRTKLIENVRKTGENRRKFLRIETSHHHILLKIFQSDRTYLLFSASASTLDVSRGGIRVATPKPLTEETMLQLSFDKSFPESLHDVTGQVEWCRKQVDGIGYQAGVSFLGDRVRDEIGHYLILRHE